MPKSFLVKKKLKIKSSLLDEESKLFHEKDERKMNSEDTCVQWKPFTREVREPDLDAWTRSTPAEQSVSKRYETESKLAADLEKKSTKHDIVQLNNENITLPGFDVQPRDKSPKRDCKQECNRCKRTYTTNSAFVKHQRYYCNFFQTKSFTCKYCDKVYLSLGALKMHIRTHTLPCECMICGKAFSRPWLLQGHIRTHTGEKPYKCSSCHRAFADRSNLRAHLQTHSDIKKYRCERCSKTFSRMSLLLKHQHASCPSGIR